MSLIDYTNPNDPWITTGYDPYRGMTDEQRMKTGCLQLAGMALFIVVAMLLCLLFSSCTTTKYVTVEKVKTDTLWQNYVVRDSIHVHDSVSVWQKGDTVTIDRWHTKYVLNEKHDTTYIAKHDSVPVPYPVEKLVERQLTWWQRTQMYAGDVLLLLLIGGVAVFILRKRIGL